MNKHSILRWSVTLFTALMLMAGLLLPVRPSSAAPNLVPTPIQPNGSTTDTTPIFRWTRETNATHYQIQVKSGNAQVYIVLINAGGGTCGTSNCANTPATVLNSAPHVWRVRARVGGVWGAWSAFKAFNVQVGGFNSQFNGDHAGWITLIGTWNDGGTYYWSGGQNNNYSITRHENLYSTFTYEVQMRRNFGVPGNYQGIFFRASSDLYLGFNFIASGFYFAIHESGHYRIGYVDIDNFFTVLYEPSALLNIGGYNKLKVTANGSFLQFFINGTKVADGYFEFSASGHVGIVMWDDEGTLQVNYATLSLSAPAADGADDEPGVIHLGTVTLGSGTPGEP